MPPTNNPDESDIRRGSVAQRNVRYQPCTEGARVFSVILSFILTCNKQGVPHDEVLVALAGGVDPADIFKVGQVAPNRWWKARPKSRAAPDGASWTRGLQAPRRPPPLTAPSSGRHPVATRQRRARPRRAGHAAQKALPAPPAQKAPPLPDRGAS